MTCCRVFAGRYMTKGFRYMTKGLVSFPAGDIWLKSCASFFARRAYRPSGSSSGAPVPSNANRGLSALLVSPEPDRRSRPGVTPPHRVPATAGLAGSICPNAHAGCLTHARVVAVAKTECRKGVNHEDHVSHVCSAPGHALVSERGASPGHAKAARCSTGIGLYRCLSRHID